MNDATTNAGALPLAASHDALTDVLRAGAQQLLAQAIRAEVDAYLDARCELRDEAGRRQVVRNGYLPERTITTGVGAVGVKQPRVHDRRPDGQREKFSSAILPPYLRKTKSLEELIPWLYLPVRTPLSLIQVEENFSASGGTSDGTDSRQLPARSHRLTRPRPGGF